MKQNNEILYYVVYQFARVDIMKHNQLGGFNNRNVFLIFWGLQVHDDGVSGSGFSWGLPPRLADGRPPQSFSVRLSLVSLCIPIPLLLKTPSRLDQNPSAGLIYLNHPFKGTLCKCSHILWYWESGLEHTILGDRGHKPAHDTQRQRSCWEKYLPAWGKGDGVI